jgi:tRNA(Ile)-lysidine synthetase-like protein
LAPLGQGQKIVKRQRLDIREQLRAAGVPAWLRDRVPVLMDEDKVVLVPAVPPWFDVPLVTDACSVGPIANGWALSVIQSSMPT